MSRAGRCLRDCQVMQIIGTAAVIVGSMLCRRSGWAGMTGGGCSEVGVVAGSASRWWKRLARWRLRQRSAAFLVFPSACLRARYVLVAGSWLARDRDCVQRSVELAVSAAVESELVALA
jgi:hypothetical protein